MRIRRIDHDTVDSTSERAFAAITDGSARDGDVHVARAQTRGRGTRGRTWFSPPGEGLYASLVHLPAPPPLSPAALTMAAGLAVLDGVRALGLRGAHLKWPNDVVVAGAKLAGVLIETRGLDPERPHYVIGIGVNVRQRSFPAELEAERRATSLVASGVDCTIEDALNSILAHVPRRCEEARGRSGLGREFLQATDLSGREVIVQVGADTLAGTLIDLSADYGLVLLERDDRERFVPLESVLAVRPRA